MNAKALAELDKADGFEVGVGPSVVVVDEGKGKSMTTTTMKDDVYAFIFSQKGLMAGLGIQGNKIGRSFRSNRRACAAAHSKPEAVMATPQVLAPRSASCSTRRHRRGRASRRL